MKRKYKVLIFVIAGIALLIGITAISLSAYMVKATEKSIFTAETFKSEKKADCILILGAGVKDGKPKPMLRDRLLTGIELYKSGAADKIIMSGDHGRTDYDEVNVMRSFAIEHGVRAEDIFLDHAGFSTYDSVYRAKNIFGAGNIIIVSQNIIYTVRFTFPKSSMLRRRAYQPTLIPTAVSLKGIYAK